MIPAHLAAELRAALAPSDAPPTVRELALADAVARLLAHVEPRQPSDRPSGECWCGRPMGHGMLTDDGDEVLR